MADRPVTIGFRLDDGTRLSLPMARIARHMLVTGTTGAGKSAAITGMLLGILRDTRSRAVVVDPKFELLDTIRMFVGALGERMPWLAERLLVIDPFATASMVPLDLLRPEEGVEPAVHAHVVASALGELFEGGLGPRMSAALTLCVRAAMQIGGSLIDVVELLRDGAYGTRLSERIADAEARRAVLEQLPRESPLTLDALRVRLEWLLSGKSVRAFLCGKDGISGKDILKHGLSLVSLGPPSGMGDVGRAIAGLIMARLSAAVFARRVDELPPAFVVIDEAPEVLRRSAADEMERLLSMARSRRVAVWSLAQSFEQIASASTALARSLSTNAALRLCFRGSPHDVAEVAHALPVTGAMRDPDRPDVLLSPAQERALLIAHAASLPPRCALFAEAGIGSAFVRTPTLPFAEARARFDRLAPEARERVHRGVGAMAVEEILKRVGAVPGSAQAKPSAVKARSATSSAKRPRLVLP